MPPFNINENYLHKFNDTRTDVLSATLVHNPVGFCSEWNILRGLNHMYRDNGGVPNGLTVIIIKRKLNEKSQISRTHNVCLTITESCRAMSGHRTTTKLVSNLSCGSPTGQFPCIPHHSRENGAKLILIFFLDFAVYSEFRNVPCNPIHTSAHLFPLKFTGKIHN